MFSSPAALFQIFQTESIQKCLTTHLNDKCDDFFFLPKMLNAYNRPLLCVQCAPDGWGHNFLWDMCLLVTAAAGKSMELLSACLSCCLLPLSLRHHILQGCLRKYDMLFELFLCFFFFFDLYGWTIFPLDGTMIPFILPILLPRVKFRDSESFRQKRWILSHLVSWCWRHCHLHLCQGFD